ncbi:MAG: holin [Frankiaceae bacterium]
MTAPLSPATAVKQYVVDVAERAGWTFAQAFAAVAVAAGPFDVLRFHWSTALDVALSAAVLSIIKSLGAGTLGSLGTASVTKAVVPASMVDATCYGRHADAVPKTAAEVQDQADEAWIAQLRQMREESAPSNQGSDMTRSN